MEAFTTRLGSGTISRYTSIMITIHEHIRFFDAATILHDSILIGFLTRHLAHNAPKQHPENHHESTNFISTRNILQQCLSTIPTHHSFIRLSFLLQFLSISISNTASQP
jgi:hypothetical protein